MEEKSYLNYLPIALGAALVAFVISLVMRRQRKSGSFRDDPIGALKDRGEIVAGRAQEATEEALARLQATLDEIRDRMPEVSRKQLNKGRKNVNHRLADLSSQGQDRLKELRASGVFSR